MKGRRSMYTDFQKGRNDFMSRNKLALTTLALGAAYLLRNDKSRQKLKEQFRSLAGQAKR